MLSRERDGERSTAGFRAYVSSSQKTTCNFRMRAKSGSYREYVRMYDSRCTGPRVLGLPSPQQRAPLLSGLQRDCVRGMLGMYRVQGFGLAIHKLT